MKPVQVDSQYLHTLLKTLVMLERKQARGGVPPKGAQAAAKRGLELRRKFNRGGTMVGVARARDISNGKNLSESTVRRMKAYFDRHEVDKQGKDWDNQERPSNGKIAWLLWGGDAGRTWATMLVNRWNREDGKKELPVWLPNGDEIENLQQLASVLNTDVKTAAFHVLDEANPPKHLLAQAYKATRRVKTPEGRRRFGQPIGTIIKDDVIPEISTESIQMELPDISEKPKTRNRKPIMIVDGRVQLENYTVEQTEFVNFPKMTKTAEQLPDTPVVSELPEYTTDDKELKEDIDSLEGTWLLQRFYDSLEADQYDWEGNYGDAPNLKANVQYRIAERILNHSDTDEDLKQWTRLIRTKIWDNSKVFSAINEMMIFSKRDEWEFANDKNDQEKRYNFLQNLGLINKDVTFEDAKNGEYSKFIDIQEIIDSFKSANIKDSDLVGWNATSEAKDLMSIKMNEIFSKTSDREAFARLDMLKSVGLIEDSDKFNDFSQHSIDELIYLAETRKQITVWAGTSGDTKPEAVKFQYDVQEAFELDDAATGHLKYKPDSSVEDLDIFRKTLIRAMYAETQEFLKQNNIKSVVVYRGMSFDAEEKIPDELMDENFKTAIEDAKKRYNAKRERWIKDWIKNINQDKDFERYATSKAGTPEWDKLAKSNKGDKDAFWQSLRDSYEADLRMSAEDAWSISDENIELKKDTLNEKLVEIGTVNLDNIAMQPISSWSLDKSQAGAFADGGNFRIVLKTIAPAELIFSTAFTGIGCLNENEIVLLGRKGRVDAQWK